MTADQATVKFYESWPTFHDRLSAPITPELLATRELIGEHLADVWRDIVFPRYVTAFDDLEVADVLERRYGTWGATPAP